MKLAWMGEQRELIEALFQWGNYYVSIYKKPLPFLESEQIQLSAAEIQVIEYLLENEELKLNMAGVAKRLGVSPSTFTQIVSRLEKQELLEKYYMGNNRKDMIVMVTDKGKDVYNIYSRRLYEIWKEPVLEPLSAIPEEYRMQFAKVLSSVFLHPEEEPVTPAHTLVPARKKQ